MFGRDAPLPGQRLHIVDTQLRLPGQTRNERLAGYAKFEWIDLGPGERALFELQRINQPSIDAAFERAFILFGIFESLDEILDRLFGKRDPIERILLVLRLSLLRNASANVAARRDQSVRSRLGAEFGTPGPRSPSSRNCMSLIERLKIRKPLARSSYHAAQGLISRRTGAGCDDG